MAAADPSAAGEARLSAGQGLAPAAGPRRRPGEERGPRPAGDRRGAGGLRLAAARDRRRERGGHGLRGPVRRRALGSRDPGAVPAGARRRLPRARRRGPRARRRPRGPDLVRAQGGGAASARAPQDASRPDRRDRLLRRQRSRGGGGLARRARARARRGRRSARAAGAGLRPPRRPRLGDPAGRARRSDRLGLADPPLHRPQGEVQVRPAQGLRAAAGRAALRHVRGRVHPPGRPLYVRGPAGRCAGRGRSRAPGDRRDRPRHRPQGWQVRPFRDRRDPDHDRSALRCLRRRCRAPAPRRGAARRPLRLFPKGQADDRRRPPPGPAAGGARPRHPVRRGAPRLGPDRRAELRRPGRADRGHAPHPGRGEALDRRAALPACAQLLHAAARARGAAADGLHRLAAAQDQGRPGRRHALRPARACSRSWR